MKISLYVPSGVDLRSFIKGEIAQSKNIKSKATRKSVVKGLNKILSVIDRSGVAIFTDGDEMIIESYDGVKKLYHCGRDYKKIIREEFDPTLLVTIDAKNAAVGLTNGESVKVLWSKESLVPRKHRAGGQSQRRFERDRERALKEWLRSVVDIVKGYSENRNIIVGGCGMTKDLFIKEMPM
jgi:peptide chain release factor subunit 1